MPSPSNAAPPARPPADAQAILRHLAVVEHERARRAADPALAARFVTVKAYQQARFAHTHRALLNSPRYAAATRFFLQELYGPADFAQRDAQFARIVPALVKLFPQEIVDTVALLAELHALAETLDGELATMLPSTALDASAYIAAWRAVGKPELRSLQVDLVIAVGRSIDRYTRMPMLALSLRMMRGPARAAGLSELQDFLERGLATFKAMHGADDFLQQIELRERAMMARLFDASQGAASLQTELPEGG